MTEVNTHICLARYEGGFCGTLCAGRSARYGIYMGDIGARPRSWWRSYARSHGYVLVERES